MGRIVIVGECYPGDEQGHVWSLQPHSPTGRNLLRLLEITEGDYLRRFHRVNLCAVRWCWAMAIQTAAVVMAQRPRWVVLLGRRVALAFGRRERPFSVVFVGGVRYVLLPHPSGRCRTWNVPAARKRARVIMREVLPMGKYDWLTPEQRRTNAKKAAATMRKRYGDDYFRGIGGKGGRETRDRHGSAHYQRASAKGKESIRERMRDGRLPADFYARLGAAGGRAKAAARKLPPPIL